MVGVGGFQYTEEMIYLVTKTIKNNRISQGPLVKEFEQRFAKDHECDNALFVNSGTSALHIALQALKIQNQWSDGANVLVPAVTFVATYNIVLHNGLTPVLVDIDLDDYGMSVEEAEKKINIYKPVAMIPVHLFGQPCKINKLCELAKKYNLKVIEDSCETMYAKCAGKSVGSWGDIGCFSTYVAHLLTTGVGGFVTSNNKELFDLCKSLANHGRDLSYITIDDKCPDLSKRFNFLYPGHSFRATELEAAIGLGQIDDMKRQIERRREIAMTYCASLCQCSEDLILPRVRKDCDHSFMMYPILYKGRDKLTKFLEEKCGIETRPLVSITNQPCYKINQDHYPIAKICNEQGFYIGCHPFITDAEVRHVCESFWRYFHG